MIQCFCTRICVTQTRSVGRERNVRSGERRACDIAEAEEAEVDQVEEGRIGFPARLGWRLPARPGTRPRQGNGKNK